MVDAISNMAGRAVSPLPTEAKPVEVKQSSAAPIQVGAASAGVEITSLSTKDMVAGADKTPPVDMEAVVRIRSAIAQGAYPVDADKIVASLMAAFDDLRA